MRQRIYGQVIDDESRCVHYATALDVVAMRFACCDRYYPCHRCHADDACHAATPWPRSRRDEPAVLCGVCRSSMLADEYFAAHECAVCGAAFNPRCAAHRDYYFEP